MRKLLVNEFVSLDGGFEHGGWTVPYWHDEIWVHHFQPLLKEVDALLLGRRTYVTHAEAFEPNPAGDPFGQVKKYVVSRTLTKSLWRDTTIIRDDVANAVWALKEQPGKNLVDELPLLLYPLMLGGGKRLLPDGVVGLHYGRAA